MRIGLPVVEVLGSRPLGLPGSRVGLGTSDFRVCRLKGLRVYTLATGTSGLGFRERLSGRQLRGLSCSASTCRFTV